MTPIAIDKTSALKFSTASTTLSHTCSGSNLLLIVCVAIDSSGAETTTSVTYNSVGMTQVGPSVTQSNKRTSLWYLVNPTTGANNISITNSGGVTCWISGISLNNVDQANPVDVNNIANAASTTPQIALTPSTTGNFLVASMIEDKNAPTPIAGTRTITSDTTDAFSAFYTGIATQPTIGWTLTSSSWSMTAIAVRAIPQGFRFNFIRPRSFSPGLAR